MAQPRVNDFFTTRKKRDTHPAKRRKVEIQPSSSSSQSCQPTDLTLQRDKQATDSNPEDTYSNSSCQPESREENVLSKCKAVDSISGQILSNKASVSNRSHQVARRNVRSKATKSRNRCRLTSQNPDQLDLHGKQKATGVSDFKFTFKSQKKITDLLESKFPTGTDSHSANASDANSETPSAEIVNKNISYVGPDLDVVANNEQTNDFEVSEENMLITEEITSVEDDHWNSRSACTPRKRTIEVEADTSKLRKCKVPHRRVADRAPSLSHSAKKKLELDSSQKMKPTKNDSMLDSNVPISVSEGDVASDESEGAEVEQKGHSGKNFLIRLVSEVESPDVPLSPLAMTPERSSDPERVTPEPQDKTPSPEPCSPKLKNLSQKLRGLSKMNGKALKNRLKQNGKLDEVKQKLDSLGKVVDKSEEATAAKDEVDGEIAVDEKTKAEKEMLPAYQRFEYLAKKGVPTLSLPFSYKSLEGTFQAMDSVVSMLHNRSEMCTYSKLKAAVQNFTKRNFEEKALGQIKSVAPDAYFFRQEKNVCPKENKKGYSLTIEADLSKEVPENSEGKISKTPEGKPVFTALALIHRKQYFHNSLLSLVMKHHKAFLASLKPPLSIPDSKITRWHPKFQLDQVPDIIPSPLPQPPDVRVYHSAKDVLDAQKGRLNPRVEEALAKVSAENKQADSISTTSSPTPGSKPSVPSTTKSPSMKGIPPALLAKIRAKEALKMEAALTRDPEEDNKTKMMGHLPEMIRIIRSYFITEKKPALPLEAIYKKLEDSYRSGISRKDVEQHVKLMAELVPELVSVVEIKRGSFLKLDRNVDAQGVCNKIMNLVKSRK